MTDSTQFSGSSGVARFQESLESSLVTPEQDWAARVFGIGDEETRSAVAVFDRLHADNFVPSQQVGVAVAVLGTTRDLSMRVEPHRLQQDVDSFAGEFFELDPNARSAKWKHLRGNCDRLPWLRRRLDRMKPALDLVRPSFEQADDQVAELGNFLCDSIVADPYDGSIVRQQMLRERKSDWGNACEVIRSDYPDLAQRVPAYLRQLRRNNLGDETLAFQLAQRSARRAEPVETAVDRHKARRANSSSAWWIILIVLFGLRLVTSLGWSSSSNRNRQPDFTPPINQFRQAQPSTGVESWEMEKRKELLRGLEQPAFNSSNGADPRRSVSTIGKPNAASVPYDSRTKRAKHGSISSLVDGYVKQITRDDKLIESMRPKTLDTGQSPSTRSRIGSGVPGSGIGSSYPGSSLPSTSSRYGTRRPSSSTRPTYPGTNIPKPSIPGYTPPSSRRAPSGRLPTLPTSPYQRRP